MTIKEYLKLDGLNKRVDGTEMSHEEVFAAVVNKIGLDVCVKFIPATREQIIEALKSDEHLNNIPLSKWDSAAGYIVDGSRVVPMNYGLRSVMASNGFNVLSLSDCVCTLKQAAKMWAKEELPNG